MEGVRSNQLIGYGLVVGLPGTGEKSNAFTEQTFRTMLNNFGIKVPDNIKPKIKDVAPVAIHADLPPFAKPGQTIDVTVSAIGEAKSLRGGTLLQSFLKGLDGRVYAVAQGSLVVGGLGPRGRRLQGGDQYPDRGSYRQQGHRGAGSPELLQPGDTITFNLNRPDFTTARRLADVVNDLVGPNTAQALDATSVKVYAPRDPGQRVSYLATIENLEVDPASEAAKIIVNSRTGTIVIGSQVRLKPAAISHGGLTVTIAENQQVSQPNPLSGGQTAVTNNSTINVQQEQGRMFKLDTGATLDDLVRAVNQVGVAPGDLMAILEALQQAGAIEGQLVIL